MQLPAQGPGKAEEGGPGPLSLLTPTHVGDPDEAEAAELECPSEPMIDPGF